MRQHRGGKQLGGETRLAFFVAIRKAPMGGGGGALRYFLAVFQNFNPLVDGGTAYVEFLGKV